MTRAATKTTPRSDVRSQIRLSRKDPLVAPVVAFLDKGTESGFSINHLIKYLLVAGARVVADGGLPVEMREPPGKSPSDRIGAGGSVPSEVGPLPETSPTRRKDAAGKSKPQHEILTPVDPSLSGIMALMGVGGESDA